MLTPEQHASISGLSNAEYHANSAISRSAIIEMLKSPLHFYDKYLSPDREPRKSTKAMTMGTALHTLITEPEKLNDVIAIMDDINLTTKGGRAYKQVFYQTLNGREILKQAEFNEVAAMANATLEHTTVQQFLNGSQCEVSIFWNDADTGLACKARPDIWNGEYFVMAELKTARDSSVDAFKRAVRDHGYHIQAAMQIDGVYAVTGQVITDFVFIVICNVRPYTPYIYRLDTDDIEQGRQEYKAALRVFKKCFEENCWTKDRQTILPIKMHPNYSTHFNTVMEIYTCQS